MYSVLYTTVTVLLGLTLKSNIHVSCEPLNFDIPEGYTPESTVVLHSERAEGKNDVRELLKWGHNIHVKWVPTDEQQQHHQPIVALLEGIHKIKDAESSTWNPFAKVVPVTVLVDPIGRDYVTTGQQGVERCVKDITWLDDFVWRMGKKHRHSYYTSWSKEKKHTRAITVLFSAPIPRDCYAQYSRMQRKRRLAKTGGASDELMVGLNPHITNNTVTQIDVWKDTTQSIVMVTRTWPTTFRKDSIFEFLRALPEGVKLRFAGMPTDQNSEAGEYAYRAMKFFVPWTKGCLFYSVELPRTEPVSPSSDADDNGGSETLPTAPPDVPSVAPDQDEDSEPDLPPTPGPAEQRRQFLELLRDIALYEVYVLLCMGGLSGLWWWVVGLKRNNETRDGYTVLPGSQPEKADSETGRL
eukprot:GDKI01031586.1.p1 GENE.GDKI01031586.1~~GDKI01031586.1.p1  ORF type:complete len:427 (+),score=76.94 GDKI01031586.1:50-1282(+)